MTSKKPQGPSTRARALGRDDKAVAECSYALGRDDRRKRVFQLALNVAKVRAALFRAGVGCRRSTRVGLTHHRRRTVISYLNMATAILLLGLLYLGNLRGRAATG
jgi:hypothetical protein